MPSLLFPYNAQPKGTPVTIGIRSDDIIVSRERIGQTSARNLLEGTIQQVVQSGPEVDLLTFCGVNLKVRITPQALEALDLRPGVKGLSADQSKFLPIAVLKRRCQPLGFE